MMRWIADWVRLGRCTTGCGEGGVKPPAGGGVAGVSGSGGGGGCGGARLGGGGGGGGGGGRPGPSRHEHGVADLDLLAALEERRLDAAPVDERAVARAEVVERGATVGEDAQRRVAARSLAVGEHEVDPCLAADRELRSLDLDGRAGAWAGLDR